MRLLLCLLLTLCLGALAFTAVPAPDAWWSFEEGSGATTCEVSGQLAFNLTNVDWTSGVVGKGLAFHGATSTARLQTPPELQPTDAVTVSCWFQVAPEGLAGNVEGLGLVSAGSSYLLRISSGHVPSFHIFTTGWAPVMGTDKVLPNQWYQATGVYDGAVQQLYINGQFVAGTPRKGPINHDLLLELGRQVNALTGALDEVRIWKQALSVAQVAALYAADLEKAAPGFKPGHLAEQYDELFGATRHNPAPIPTFNHLPKGDFSFVALTDTHIGQDGEEGAFCHNWRVEEAIRQINGLAPDAVFHCGDIITVHPFSANFEAQCARAVELLAELEPPTWLTAGNHDVGNQRNMRVWNDTWLANVKIKLNDILFQQRYRDIYQSYFGPDYYSVELAGCRFIVFNNGLFNSGYPLEDDQFEWLERELATSDEAKLTFLICHNVPFWASPDEGGVDNYEPLLLPARKRLLDLLEAHPVDAWYTGHTHFGFANMWQGQWLRTLNSTTFNRNYAGIDQQLGGWEQVYDPFKVGYLLTRVTGKSFHESWVPLYWQVGEAPEALAPLLGKRLVGRAASEKVSSTLAIACMPPIPSTSQPRLEFTDRPWRLAEEIGAKWTLTPNAPVSGDDWLRLERGLGLSSLRGPKTLVSLSADANLPSALIRLRSFGGPLGGVMLLNGAPSDPSAPLSSWQAKGSPEDWSKACESARLALPEGSEVWVGRLPFLGEGAQEALETACAALEGKAAGIAVWAAPQGLPEELIPALAAAAESAQSHGLGLWLDIAGWQNEQPGVQAAYFLRLATLCKAAETRLCWWISQSEQGGLLDEHLDPTWLFYAAQAFEALSDGAASNIRYMEAKGLSTLHWKDGEGHNFLAWWSPDGGVAVTDTALVSLPKGALCYDLLHARELLLKQGDPVPLATWPLIARW